MKTFELPPDIINRYEQMIAKNNKLFYGREYEDARLGFKKAYKMLFLNQPQDGRFHKGTELFNIASTYMQDRKPKTAFKYFIRAYIEDLITYGNKANDAPAAQVLTSIYKLKNNIFKEIQQVIENADKRGIVIHNPQYVEKTSVNLQHLLKTQKITSTTPIKRKAGQFKSSWDRRVFVGGNYKDQLVILKQIKTIVDNLGYDPVFAEDFDIPKEEIHHHSLMLLHECKKAIFEISSEAGQLLEIERLRDFGITPLIIYQSSKQASRPKITAMVSTLCSRYKWKPHAYPDQKQLRQCIKSYLETK